MSDKFTESDVEDATLLWLEGLGYTVGHAPDIAPNEPQAERDSYDKIDTRDATLLRPIRDKLRVGDI